MISSRRRAHRRAFAVLAIVLPVLIVGALATRPDAPVSPENADQLFRAAGFASSTSAEPASIVFDESSFEVSVTGSPTGGRALVVRPGAAISEPDLLVYWARAIDATSSLPGDAVLLGTLAGDSARELPLPPQAAETPGALIVYSLGYQRVVSRIPLEAR